MLQIRAKTKKSKNFFKKGCARNRTPFFGMLFMILRLCQAPEIHDSFIWTQALRKYPLPSCIASYIHRETQASLFQDNEYNHN